MENTFNIKPKYGLWINGEEVESHSGKYFDVNDPSNGNFITKVAEGDEIDIDRAVKNCREAFEDGRWSNMTPRERCRILMKAAQILRDRLDYIIELEVRSTGRAIREMKAQLPRIPEWLEYFGALSQTCEGGVTNVQGPLFNYYKYIPLGVCGLITPWNHPLLIAVKKVAPAIAAGNCVVVKPSELAPVTVIELARILGEAGVPPGVINVVTGFGSTAGKALSEHTGIDKLDITGGTPTGRIVCSNAGKNLIPVTAELGGKAPLIVFEDSDIDEAVNAAAFAAFIATGQTCVAATRLLVHESILDKVKEKFVLKAKSIRMGPPMDLSTQLGPVISKSQRDRIIDFVERANKEGATILYGGDIPSDESLKSGFYYMPTLISNVTPDMNVVKEEVFGPVVVILSFKDEEEAIKLANDSPYGLGAAIWTKDIKRAHRVIGKIRAGIIWVNDYHKNDPSSPWGGMKGNLIKKKIG